jgi:hypothetical protein
MSYRITLGEVQKNVRAFLAILQMKEMQLANFFPLS